MHQCQKHVYLHTHGDCQSLEACSGASHMFKTCDSCSAGHDRLAGGGLQCSTQHRNRVPAAAVQTYKPGHMMWSRDMPGAAQRLTAAVRRRSPHCRRRPELAPRRGLPAPPPVAPAPPPALRPVPPLRPLQPVPPLRPQAPRRPPAGAMWNAADLAVLYTAGFATHRSPPADAASAARPDQQRCSRGSA